MNAQQAAQVLSTSSIEYWTRGIVIDAWVRVSLVGIDLIAAGARIVVASVDIQVKHSEAVGQVAPVVQAHDRRQGL